MQATGHMDWLFHQAMALCQNTQDAQELTQETLLAALQADEPENPRAWLLTVLRRRHADLLRRKYRLPTVCIDAIMELPAPESPDDDEAAQVRREVAYLAGRYREAIVRHYLLGENTSDVADALEIPRGTVLSRLSAGREQMRKGLTHMEDYGRQSYQPERLDVSCNGRPGLHDEPWSLVSGDLMKQNLLIAAYDAPVTPVELARHLGIPTAYVEQAADALVQGELMRRIGGKVVTDFLITTPDMRLRGLEVTAGSSPRSLRRDHDSRQAPHAGRAGSSLLLPADCNRAAQAHRILHPASAGHCYLHRDTAHRPGKGGFPAPPGRRRMDCQRLPRPHGF